MIKFDLATSKRVGERIDLDTGVITKIQSKERVPVKRGKGNQKDSGGNKRIGEKFEGLSKRLFPGFDDTNPIGNEDLRNENIGIEVKSGKIIKSHAVINQNQIDDAQENYGGDNFYYTIYFYTREGKRILPEVLFVFPLPVIISFFNEVNIIPRTLNNGKVRRFVVMRFRQALGLFSDIQKNHKDTFETRIYSLDKLKKDSPPVMCIVDYVSKESQHILSLDPCFTSPQI